MLRTNAFVCLLPCVLIVVALGTTAASDQPRRPNVIYILTDDLGYGDLGCYGQTKFETPHIDALARSGLRFTQHYAGSTVCAPSRSALLTGQHTGHTPVRGNAEVKPEGQVPMPADTFTVGHLMQKAGYKTGIFGKWGLGAPASVSEPLNMGFDRFYGYNCQQGRLEGGPLQRLQGSFSAVGALRLVGGPRRNDQRRRSESRIGCRAGSIDQTGSHRFAQSEIQLSASESSRELIC